MALFEAAGVHKRFGDRVVLERHQPRVRRGRVHGIMGPNGAGKTTCFNVLTGRFKPEPRPITARRRGHHRAWRRTAIAAQGHLALVPDHEPVRRYTALRQRHGRPAGVPRPRLRHAARRWRADSGCADEAAAVLDASASPTRRDVRAKDLSYGDRRALEIAVALAAEPRMLFLDEPTSGLGADGAQRLADAGRASSRASSRSSSSSTTCDFLFALADRISVIHWGQVIARGTPHELRRTSGCKRSNLGRFA